MNVFRPFVLLMLACRLGLALDEPKPFSPPTRAQVKAFAQDYVRKLAETQQLTYNVDKAVEDFASKFRAKYSDEQWNRVMGEATESVSRLFEETFSKQPAATEPIAVMAAESLSSLIEREGSVTIPLIRTKFGKSIFDYFSSTGVDLPQDVLLVLFPKLNRRNFGREIARVWLWGPFGDEYAVDLRIQTDDLNFAGKVSVFFADLPEATTERFFGSRNIIEMETAAFYSDDPDEAEMVLVHETQHLVDKLKGVVFTPDPLPETFENEGKALYAKVRQDNPEEFKATVEATIANQKGLTAEAAEKTVQKLFVKAFSDGAAYRKNPWEIRARRTESRYLIRKKHYDDNAYRKLLTQEMSVPGRRVNVFGRSINEAAVADYIATFQRVAHEESKKTREQR